MSETYNLYEAKTNLSSLVDRAVNGEEIVIAKNGRPQVKLVAVAEPGKKRRIPFNAMGVTFISEDFDAPLPDEIERAFRGESEP